VWAFFRISGGLFNPAVRTPSFILPTHKLKTPRTY
jgi:hypothetical protein